MKEEYSEPMYILSDRLDILRAVKSLDMALFVWELVINSKKSLLGQCLNPHAEDGVELVYARIHELLEEYDINIDNMVE